MGGRLHVLVLVVALASRPSVQSNDVLYDVAERCRNTVGEQAGADVLNTLYQLTVCTRFEDLYGEVITTMERSGVKEAIGTVCRRKDELLACSDQAFETIKRCLNEDEQEGFAVLQGTVEPSMDFLCQHDDDIVQILGSQEEMQCVSSLGQRAVRCKPYESRNAEEILDSLKSLENGCKKLDAFMDCVNSIAGDCKDSTFLRLYNDLKTEVTDDVVCSNKDQLPAPRPSMQNDDLLYFVVDRCRNTAGEQAAADVLNIMHQFSVCTRFQDLYGEVMTAAATSGLKEAVGTVCRRKDELLTCSDQALETIKRCLNEDEQEGIAILRRTIEPTMDFFCQHDDDLVQIFGSQEETQCVTRLSAKAERCKPYQSTNPEEILDTFKSLEEQCKKIDTFMDCLNSIAGDCKDSTFLRLYNDLKTEVMDDVVCSNKDQLPASRPTMQSTDVLHGVPDRCRHVDLLKVLAQLRACIKFDDLYEEMARAKVTSGLKAAIGTVCRRKDELLTCSDQAFNRIWSCLDQEEKHRLAFLQGRIEPLMDFLCKQDDEIVAILQSQEELQCLTSLGAMAARCDPRQSKSVHEILYSLRPMEQRCSEADDFMDCVNTITGNCKDSSALRFINDMKHEVIDAGLCFNLVVPY